ncbi:MAG: FAD binding domain-containing protein [Sneathiella sp.]
MGDYFRPEYLSDALTLLSEKKLTVIAGGTDYFPTKVGEPLDDSLLDITAIKSLSGVKQSDDGWHIGPTTTWSEILQTDLPALFDGLKAAAKEVGGRQVQNSGTIAGNICNASPAADSVPVLIALGAIVEISQRKGSTWMAIDDFIVSNRQTKLQSNEILTNIFIPHTDPLRTRSSFYKLGSRRYLVISTVMIAGLIEWNDQFQITNCKIAIGSCSAVAVRLNALEEVLVGLMLSEDLAQKIEVSHLAALTPIDDVRATADYRSSSAFVLVKRMLNDWRIAHDT